MKKIFALILLMAAAVTFARAEENRDPAFPRRQLRRDYKQTHRKLGEINKSLFKQESPLRSGRLNIGLSGDFLFRITRWQNSPLRDGFGNLELGYFLGPNLNLAGTVGYHHGDARTVIPVSLMVQLIVSEQEQFSKTPAANGLELGVIRHGSNVAGQSATSFVLGVCHYQFFAPRFVLVSSFDWLTPSFHNQNMEIKTGFKLFL